MGELLSRLYQRGRNGPHDFLVRIAVRQERRLDADAREIDSRYRRIAETGPLRDHRRMKRWQLDLHRPGMIYRNETDATGSYQIHNCRVPERAHAKPRIRLARNEGAIRGLFVGADKG